MKNLHQQVLELLPQCIEDRRWLHRHAELSFREYKTADYLEQALCELEGLELSPSYTHQCDGGTAHRKARPLPRHSCGHRRAAHPRGKRAGLSLLQ